MGALEGERGAFGSDGSGARSVLSAMLAEAVRTCSMRLGPFCGPPRSACKAAHPVQDAVVDWMMSHAGEHAADVPIARPWVLVLTRPERSPTGREVLAPGGCHGMRMNTERDPGL